MRGGDREVLLKEGEAELARLRVRDACDRIR
jgi:hypothetical protein